MRRNRRHLPVLAHRPASWLAVLAMAAFAALAIAAERVGATQYRVVECHPGLNAAAPDAHAAVSSGHFSLGSDCGQETRGLSINAAGRPPNGYQAFWEFDAPPGTVFSQVDSTLGLAWANGIGPWVTLWHPGIGTASHGFSGQGWQGDSATNTTMYRVTLGCNGNSCGPGTEPHVYMTHLWFTIDDPTPPSLDAGGSLLTAGTKHGAESLGLSSWDPTGSGFANWKVFVNGTLAQLVTACNPPRTLTGELMSFRPCGDSASRSVAIDTQAAPWRDGSNDLRICAYDVAGNQSMCLQRTVEVDNSCVASSGTEATSLDAGIERGRGELRESASAKSSEPVVVQGTLRSGSGTPVNGASVCVFQQIDIAGASNDLVSVPTTQDNGRFSATLQPGASRKIVVAYRHNNHVLRKTLSVTSKAVPTLRVAQRVVHHGGNARFRGQIPGPEAKDRNVTLQARVGKRWRTFKSVPTDGEGRFRGLYRFTRSSGTTRYTFRALVKRQAGYPYEPGPSRKRRIKVRG